MFRRPATKGEQTHGSKLRDGWTIEWAAALLSALALAGLIILLALVDGGPSFNWHGVTVNAIVAILTTVSKSSLMVALSEAIGQAKWILFTRFSRTLYDMELVDLASRDALGRINILRRMPLGIASIGAIAALLGLAFDPFSQQLVHTAPHVRYTDDDGVHLPIANRYGAGNLFISFETTHYSRCNGSVLSGYDNVFTTADFGIQSSVLSGLTLNNTIGEATQQLSPSCTTGNCTWKPVESLGICSKCTDLTDKLNKYNSFVVIPQWILYGQGQFGPESDGNATTFALPNGLWLENKLGWTYDQLSNSDSDGFSYAVGATVMSSFGTGDPKQTNTFQDSDALIWAMSMIRAEPGDNNAAWPNLPVQAMECGIYYCVNTYTANVTNGVVYEDAAPVSDAARDPTSWQPIPSLGQDPVTTTLDQSQIDSIHFQQCVSTVNRSDLSFGGRYNISWKAVNTISEYMYSTFTTPPTNNQTASLASRNASQQMNGYYLQVHDNYQWGPPSLQPLQASPDLNLTFAVIARSMTNALRTGSDTPPLRGQSGTVQILVNVQWPWIALPVVVLLAGLAQLAVSVVVTRRVRAPIWKSSFLAALSRGEVVAPLLAECETLGEMEEVAEREKVDLFAAPAGGGKGGGRRPGSNGEDREQGLEMGNLVRRRSRVGTKGSVDGGSSIGAETGTSRNVEGMRSLDASVGEGVGSHGHGNREGEEHRGLMSSVDITQRI